MLLHWILADVLWEGLVVVVGGYRLRINCLGDIGYCRGDWGLLGWGDGGGGLLN